MTTPFRLISVIRRPDAAYALVSDESLALHSVPVETVARSVYPGRDQFLKSWRFLGNAKATDEDALYHLVIVLRESVPEPGTDHTAPLQLPKEWDEDEKPVRATAAHPRAYKGTKTKPLKQARLESVNLRPHLCNVAALRKVVAPLMRWMPRVRARLNVEGVLENAYPRLPARFVRYIWPNIRTRPRREIARYLSLFAALEQGGNDRLIEAVARLVAESEESYPWCEMAASLPEDRRVTFVVKLLKSGTHTVRPSSEAGPALAEMSDLASDERFPEWLDMLLPEIRKGAPLDYLGAGFRLAAQFPQSLISGAVGYCAGVPETEIAEIGATFDDGWLASTLWRACGQYRHFADVIRRRAWKRLAPETAARYLWILAKNDAGKEVLQCAPRIEALLLSLNHEYQRKAIEFIGDWLWASEKPRAMARRFLLGDRLIRRLAAPPFHTHDGASSACYWFLRMKSSKLLNQFLSAPDRSFLAMERACRRENDARLITYGFGALTQRTPDFCMEAFLTAPAKLMHAAKALGTVSHGVRPGIVMRCEDHPLFQIDVLHMPLERACQCILESLKESYANPIPARLKQWLRGEISLSQSRQERYARVVAARLIQTKLDLVEHSVVEWLKRGLPVDQVSGAENHALRMLGFVDDNRRGLRKFLNAYWSGDRDYLSRHPATKEWYRKHPSVRREVWENGVTMREYGLTVELERDPFEVLKLGTYVGSCLSVGGLCAYSSVAALLDVNKQVLYARDQRGRVIGRQLIAISDDDRLVCFSVYPASTSAAVKKLFREYDYALSKELNLPLFRPGDSEEYIVSPVLSVYWWNDGAWDFQTTPASQSRTTRAHK